MKTKQIAILAVLICLAIPAFAQQTIAGRWEGKLDGLPWITIQITQDHENVSGTAAFYIHHRDHPGGPSNGLLRKVETDLVNARLSWNTLLFEVRNPDVMNHDVMNHEKSGVTSDPSSNNLLEFKMTLTGKDEGLLEKVGKEDGVAPVKMTRQKGGTL